MPLNLKVYFLKPSCGKSSEIMGEAECKAYGIETEELKEEDLNQSVLDDLANNKSHLVVLEKFEGVAYETLKNIKCVTIGPWCLRVSITEGLHIPHFDWPIFNLAMIDCVICCSGLSKMEKARVKHLIEKMGGRYTQGFLNRNTHLVTNTVYSEKYLSACQYKKPVMLLAWIDAVWEASQDMNIHSSDSAFDKYKCLPFNGVRMTATGIVHELNDLVKVIEKNGGKFSRTMNVSETDLLICGGENITSSKKFIAARRKNIHCVTMDYITDSIAAKYSLPDDKYLVKCKTSTPVKKKTTDLTMDPNFSMISHISGMSMVNNTLQETLIEGNQSVCKTSNASENDDANKLLETINLSKVKMAGPFLDGCSIYLVGFLALQKEFINKILKFSGATRFDMISDRISHVVVGSNDRHELRSIASKGFCGYIVNIKWLIDSIHAESPLLEDKYLMKELSSPKTDLQDSLLSKKGLKLLRTDTTIVEPNTSKSTTLRTPEQTPKELMAYFDQEEDDTLGKLLAQVNSEDFVPPNRSETSTKLTDTNISISITLSEQNESTKLNEDKTVNETSTFVQNQSLKDLQMSHLPEERQVQQQMEVQPRNVKSESKQNSTMFDQTTADTNQRDFDHSVFDGLNFVIINFEDEETGRLVREINSMGGKIVSTKFKGIPDYAVVPFYSNKLPVTATTVITDLFISDCLKNGSIVPISYYHKFISDPPINILEKCVATTSRINIIEFTFLKKLLHHMSATTQTVLSKNNTETTLATTHLIIREASGKKYSGALKWKIHAVTPEWVLDCLFAGRKMAENMYNVTDAVRTDTALSHHTLISTPVLTRARPFPILSSDSSPSSSPTRHQMVEDTPDRGGGGARKARPSSLAPPLTPTGAMALENVRKSFLAGGGEGRWSTEEDVFDRMGMETTATAAVGRQGGAGFGIKTPETPLGAVIVGPNPSRSLRKTCARFIDELPGGGTPAGGVWKRRFSTPMSELRNRYIQKDKLLKDPNANENDNTKMDMETDVVEVEMEQDENITPEAQNTFINEKMKRFSELLTNSRSSLGSSKIAPVTPTIPVANTSIIPDSQTYSVGWDYQTEAKKPVSTNLFREKRVFMITGISLDAREEVRKNVEQLGATVSEICQQVTHLLCLTVRKSEKPLSCLAGGKWILHVNYIKACIEAGEFINEDMYEFGNPKFKIPIIIEKSESALLRLNAAHYWRKEVSRRQYGAFHDMRAIIVGNNGRNIARVVESGGGMVVDASPPYEDNIYATHCLVDAKEQATPENLKELEVLARQGIYCVSTVYLHDFLIKRDLVVKEEILPCFANFYKN